MAPEWFTNYTHPEEMLSGAEYILMYIFIIPILLLFVLWGKAIWNNVCPVIFNLREINFWEALALTTLVGFFFGI